MQEIILAILGGIVLIVLARFSRKRHEARFGAPPPGHNKTTFLYFSAWSLAYVLLGWLYLNFMINFFAALMALVVLYALSQSFLFTFSIFKDRRWSRWQQVRDSFLFASLFTLPITLMYFYAKQI